MSNLFRSSKARVTVGLNRWKRASFCPCRPRPSNWPPGRRPRPTSIITSWSQAKANIDYHVVVANHFYSVPYQLVHEQLDVRKTDFTVEFFHQGKRVAAHALSHQAGRATPLEEHRPKSHQKHLQWTPSRLIDWAAKAGPNAAQVVEEILRRQPHPE